MDSNNSAIQVFKYNGSRKVRTVDRDGEVWFVAKDVCNILEVADYHQAVERLDDDERGRYKVPTPRGIQEMTTINEPGLYKLIFKSRKTEAKNFTRWVTHEVLPAIRKTGAYAVNGDIQNHIRKLEAENKLLHEKVDAMLEQPDRKRSAFLMGSQFDLP